MLGAVRKVAGNKKPSALRTAVLRVLTAGISGYGVYAFFKHRIADYLFLRSHFVFFDYERPPALYFLDLLAMMGPWIAISYYLGRALRRCTNRPADRTIQQEEDHT